MQRVGCRAPTMAYIACSSSTSTFFIACSVRAPRFWCHGTFTFKPTFICQQRAPFSGVGPFCVRPTVYLTLCNLLYVYKRTSHAESFFFKALFSLKKPARGSSPAAILFPDRSRSFRLVRSCNSRGMLPERRGGRTVLIVTVVEEGPPFVENVVEDYM